jgi:molecular chaperone IbpA
MRTFDPTPLWRSTIGFDRLFDLIDSSLRETGDDIPALQHRADR